MDSYEDFKERCLKVNNESFEEVALRIFKYQASNNVVYNRYLNHLKINPESINSVETIPFLPIDFFKSQTIKTSEWKVEKIFRSSGTSSSTRSNHLIRDLSFYLESSYLYAQEYFGDISNMHIYGLLPSYHEQGNSSLIEMVNFFSRKGLPSSGFYLKKEGELINNLDKSKTPILVFGVSYALLDLAETVKKKDWSNHIFVETGGMKGRKKEIVRQELHDSLIEAFGVNEIYTEYGMTELMSQAYGTNGQLLFPPWAKALVRDLNDPFSLTSQGAGGLNVIDLANIHSCSFIETNDIVNVLQNGRFEVLGRLDNSDIRGCSLLI